MAKSNDHEQHVTIRQLVNECQVALRLEQHYKVSSICLHMSRLIVELYDRDLQEQEEEEEDDEDDDDSGDENEEDSDQVDQSNQRFFTPEWNFINDKCRQLRQFSQIAETYGDVLEFVRVRDLVCLGELVGANKRPARRASSRPVAQLDIELFSRTLRQCILLLKQLTSESKQKVQNDNAWISTDKITRLKSVSFPKHVINISNLYLLNRVTRSLSGDKLKDNDTDYHELGASPSLVVTEILRSTWFEQFWSESINQRGGYQLDRFPILVALWIIATESQHTTLGHLMSELVDQIYHQESNSCHLDELMQLTQVGSFWLSHKKRFSVTMSQLVSDELDNEFISMTNCWADTNEHEDDDDDEDEHEEEDEDEHKQNTGATRTTGETINHSRSPDVKQLLRAMIDQELIVGQQCLVCSREPSGDPLEPIHLSACPRCSLDSWPNSSTGLFCCLSLQPIHWLSLANLIEALTKLHNSPGGGSGQRYKITQLLVLTPNEYAQWWLRAAMQVDKTLFTRPFDQVDTPNGHGYREQIEISDKFQRLRVLRNHDDNNEQQHTPPASFEREESREMPTSTTMEEEFENFSLDGAQDDGSLPGAQEQEQEEQSEADKQAGGNLIESSSCLADLLTFFTTRLQFAKLKRETRARSAPVHAVSHHTNGATKWLRMSETLQLMKLAFRHSGGATNVTSVGAVYSGDLIALDSLCDERLPNWQRCRHVCLYLVARKPRRPPPPPVANDRLSSNRPSATGGNYLASGICGTGPTCVYACLSRSRTSGLQLGCGRLFSSHELIRVGWHGGDGDGAGDPTTGARFRSRRLLKYLHWRGPTTAGQVDTRQATFCRPACPACGCQLAALRPGYLAK